MSGFSRLTDSDIQLFLSGAMPPLRRLFLFLALIVNRGLRERVRNVEDQNRCFRCNEFEVIKRSLFAVKSTPPKASPLFSFIFPSWPRPLVAAGLTLCIVSVAYFMPQRVSVRSKGAGLGMTLFIKSATSYRVSDTLVVIGASDTLQPLPAGTNPQYLVLLGWDHASGLKPVVPSTGNFAVSVTIQSPPPALIPDSSATNRLICVTSTGPFLVSEAIERLSKPPFSPGLQTVPLLIEDNRCYQMFTIVRRK